MSIPVYSKSRSGGDVLILDGYEYLRNATIGANRWRCRKAAVCYGALEMGEEEARLLRPHRCDPAATDSRHEQQEPAAASPPLAAVTERLQMPGKGQAVNPAESEDGEWEYPEPEPSQPATGLARTSKSASDTSIFQLATAAMSAPVQGNATKRARIALVPRAPRAPASRRIRKRLPSRRAASVLTSPAIPALSMESNVVALPAPVGNNVVAETVGANAAVKFGQYITAMLEVLRPEQMRHFMAAIQKLVAELHLKAADSELD